MIGLYNKDSSFFEIKAPNIKSMDGVISKDVISMSVTEQMGKIETGTLSLLDNANVYSRLLRPGAELIITWGYKKSGADTAIINNDVTTLDELSKPLERRGLKAFVLSPSGSGSNGIINYNCSFLAKDLRGEKQDIVYRKGTKAKVVNDVFDRLGVTLRDVRFSRGGEVIKPETEVRQWESDFRFLTRISQEWRCLFRIGYSQAGNPVGMFIDYGNLNTSLFATWVTGNQNAIANFEYGNNFGANVISYNWNDRSGENGTGDNVQIRFVDGKIQYYRYVAENEKVTAYRLVPERITDMLEQKGTEAGIEGQIDLMSDWISVQDFESIKQFFDPVDADTAPQGIGLTVSLQCLGDITLTAGNQVTFGKGFPDRIGNSDTEFYIDKVTHTVGMNGYNCSVDIVDAFALSPLGGRL